MGLTTGVSDTRDEGLNRAPEGGHLQGSIVEVGNSDGYLGIEVVEVKRDRERHRDIA